MEISLPGGDELTPEMREALIESLSNGAKNIGEMRDGKYPPQFKPVFAASKECFSQMLNVAAALIAFRDMISDCGRFYHLGDVAQVACGELVPLVQRSWKLRCMAPSEQDDTAHARARAGLPKLWDKGMAHIAAYGDAWPKGTFGEYLLKRKMRPTFEHALDGAEKAHLELVYVIARLPVAPLLRDIPLVQLRGIGRSLYEAEAERACPRRMYICAGVRSTWTKLVGDGTDPDAAYNYAIAAARIVPCCGCTDHKKRVGHEEG